MRRRAFLTGLGALSLTSGCLQLQGPNATEADETEIITQRNSESVSSVAPTQTEEKSTSPEITAVDTDESLWPQFGYDGANTGYNSEWNADIGETEPPAIAWNFEIGTAGVAPPIVAHNSVFTGDRQGNVYRLVAENGSELWSNALEGRITSSPAVIGETLIVGTSESIYGLDISTGSEIWDFNDDDGSYAEYVYPIKFEDSSAVYASSSGSNIFRLAVDDGDQHWSFEIEGTSSTLAINNGVIYASTHGEEGGWLHAVNADDGTEIWSNDIGNDLVPSAVGNEILYTGSEESNPVAIDTADGEEIWRYDMLDSVSCSPSFTEDLVFFGGRDETVHAINRSDGTEEWSVGTNGYASSITTTDRIVLVGTQYGTLHALDTNDGAELWSVGYPGNWVGSKAVAVGNGIYLAARSKVLALEIGE